MRICKKISSNIKVQEIRGFRMKFPVFVGVFGVPGRVHGYPASVYICFYMGVVTIGGLIIGFIKVPQCIGTCRVGRHLDTWNILCLYQILQKICISGTNSTFLVIDVVGSIGWPFGSVRK